MHGYLWTLVVLYVAIIIDCVYSLSLDPEALRVKIEGEDDDAVARHAACLTIVLNGILLVWAVHSIAHS